MISPAQKESRKANRGMQGLEDGPVAKSKCCLSRRNLSWVPSIHVQLAATSKSSSEEWGRLFQPRWAPTHCMHSHMRARMCMYTQNVFKKRKGTLIQEYLQKARMQFS